MKRALTIFLTTLSMLIVMGHAVIPHSHFNPENTVISTPASLSLIDLIKTTFSHDLGANHLEEFRNYDNPGFAAINSLDAFPMLCFTPVCQKLSLTIVEIVHIFPEANRVQPPLFTSSLRAPPVFS
jgi:hypothetical protein